MIQAKFANITHYAHDLSPVLPAVRRDALADGVFIWPELAFCCFIDEQHVRRLKFVRVPSCKKPAFPQRDAQGLEVVGRNSGVGTRGRGFAGL